MQYGTRIALAVVVAAAISADCRSAAGDGDTKGGPAAPKTPVTFNKHIAPIVFNNCMSCHREGGGGPFALQTYADVKKRDAQIAFVTEDRYMPPWKAEPNFGEFMHERRLTDAQIALIKQWVDDGSPEGAAADLPKPPTFTAGWQLGKPDIILKMPEAYTVPAEGRDIYRGFVIPVEIPDGKFIKGIEFHPGNRALVHHAILCMDTERKGRALDAKDPQVGFPSGAVLAGVIPGPGGGWTPGRDPSLLPDGLAIEWKKGADLFLQLHLKPSGKPEQEQSTIGLYLTSEAPKRRLHSSYIMNNKIDIPPGDSAYKVTKDFTLQSDVELFGMLPHMHNIGKELKAVAKLPDGSTRPLIWIKDWDFSWQMYYRFAAPVKLPRGTVVETEYLYDNSAANARNPTRPPKRVRFGEQTADEMALLVLDYVITGTGTPPKPPANGKPSADAAAEFKKLDTNNSGKLNAAEFAAAAKLAAPQAKALLERFDADKDGELTPEELMALKVAVGR